MCMIFAKEMIKLVERQLQINAAIHHGITGYDMQYVKILKHPIGFLVENKIFMNINIYSYMHI